MKPLRKHGVTLGCVVNATPRPLYPRKIKPGTYTGGLGGVVVKALRY